VVIINLSTLFTAHLRDAKLANDQRTSGLIIFFALKFIFCPKIDLQHGLFLTMSYYTETSDDEKLDYCPGCDTGIDTGHTYDCNCQFLCQPEPMRLGCASSRHRSLLSFWHLLLPAPERDLFERVDPIVDNQGFHTGWENAPSLQSVISLWYYRSLEAQIAEVRWRLDY
jgi:hypothetical protein